MKTHNLFWSHVARLTALGLRQNHAALAIQPDKAPTYPETNASTKPKLDLKHEIYEVIQACGYPAEKSVEAAQAIAADPVAAIAALVADRNAWQRECERLREQLQLTEWCLQTAQEAAVDLADGQQKMIQAIGEEELASRGIQLNSFEGNE